MYGRYGYIQDVKAWCGLQNSVQIANHVTKTIEISQIDSIAMYKLPFIYIYIEDLRMNNINICHCEEIGLGAQNLLSIASLIINMGGGGPI